MSARLAVWAQNGKDGLTAPGGARYLCIHLCIAMLYVHCCTATSGLQIESAFNYLRIIGQTEMRPVVLERRNKMSMMTSYRNWRTYRNTVAELSELSNRNLADMGLVRANIREVARKAAQ